MRLLVCGGRHFDDTALVEYELGRLHQHVPITVIVHGGATKIGAAAETWARSHQVHVVRYPANFSLGRRGDSARDAFMLDDSRPETVLVFPGGRRTADLLRQARDFGARLIFAGHGDQLPFAA